jgi:hypothetical protein
MYRTWNIHPLSRLEVMVFTFYDILNEQVEEHSTTTKWSGGGGTKEYMLQGTVLIRMRKVKPENTLFLIFCIFLIMCTLNSKIQAEKQCTLPTAHTKHTT